MNHGSCEIKQSTKRRIFVVWRPHRTKRQYLARDWTKSHPWNLCSRSGFARYRETASQSYQAHEIVSSNAMLVDIWVMTEVGQPLHEIVVNLLSGRAFADDE